MLGTGQYGRGYGRPNVETTTIRKAKDVPNPPWQTWGRASLGSPELEQAETFLQEAELEQAVASYRKALELGSSDLVKEEAALRLSGMLLRLGKSKEALNEISSWLKSQNTSPKSARPAFSIVVAFAYLHRRDIDQTLAWLGVSYRNSNGAGPVARRASAEAANIISGLSAKDFINFADRWAADSFVAKLFSNERLRRARGAGAKRVSYNDWFTPNFYREDIVVEVKQNPEDTGIIADPGAIEVEDITPVFGQGPIVVGVLLPLSGKFAFHAGKVRQGIEMAVSEHPLSDRIELEVVDTQGDPVVAAAEYTRLATQSKATVVLGPLLVATTEAVAARSIELRVPAIAFTKKEGIPGLSPALFRLGTTARSQVEQLIEYGAGELRLRRFAVLHPENSSGQEFADLFERGVLARGLEFAARAGYYSGDDESMQTAVTEISTAFPQAVFLPDSLENAFPVLDLIDLTEGFEPRLLGPAQWNDPIAIRGYGQVIDKSIYAAPFYPQSKNPIVEDFVRKYTTIHKRQPELLAAQAYDATNFAIAAASGETGQGETLIDRLLSADTQYGVTGRFDVSPDGEIVRKMSVLQLKRGEIVEVISAGSVIGFASDEEKQEKEEQGRRY